MPQIAQLSETIASQFFWVALVFGFVFFVIGQGMVPKVMSTVEARDKQIADDLLAAEADRKAAAVQETTWRELLESRREKAQQIIADAKNVAAAQTAARLDEANRFLEGKLEAAEARISSAHDAALNEIDDAAGQAASDIVSRLAGIRVDEQTAVKVVKEVIRG